MKTQNIRPEYFLVNGKRKAWFSLSSQIIRLPHKQLICAPVHRRMDARRHP